MAQRATKFLVWIGLWYVNFNLHAATVLPVFSTNRLCKFVLFIVFGFNFKKMFAWFFLKILRPRHQENHFFLLALCCLLLYAQDLSKIELCKFLGNTSNCYANKRLFVHWLHIFYKFSQYFVFPFHAWFSCVYEQFEICQWQVLISFFFFSKFWKFTKKNYFCWGSKVDHFLSAVWSPSTTAPGMVFVLKVLKIHK